MPQAPWKERDLKSFSVPPDIFLVNVFNINEPLAESPFPDLKVEPRSRKMWSGGLAALEAGWKSQVETHLGAPSERAKDSSEKSCIKSNHRNIGLAFYSWEFSQEKMQKKK